MDSAITLRPAGFTLAGHIRLCPLTGKLYVGGRDVTLMIQVRQNDVVVEDAGGGERTPTACELRVDFKA